MATFLAEKKTLDLCRNIRQKVGKLLFFVVMIIDVWNENLSFDVFL